MKSGQPVVAVENLRVTREAPILRDISWRVEPGQHWIILGANGSGKTSLLNALTGYLVPSSGTVRIGTRVFGAADWRQVRTAIGLVSANLGHAIEPAQSARDIILSGRDAQINFWRRPSPTEMRAAARMLKDVRASHLAERPWRHLSQGERQRILIGRALMADLKMLFLDEPCAGLDPVAREDFLAFLSRLARHPKAPSLVLVTHHVEEIVPAFTHVLLLAGGRVLASGARREVLTSRHLSKTFESKVRLQRSKNRYRLAIDAAKGSFR